MPKTISPIKGWPKTRERTDRKGRTTITVTPRVLNPFTAKVSDYGAAMFTGALMFQLASDVAAQGGHLGVMAFAFATGGLAYPVLKPILRFVLKSKVHIRFTKDQFMVRRFGWWRRYDRHQPHSFAAIPHDKAEQEKLELAEQAHKHRMKGKFFKPTKYYADSSHVIFQYHGQRVDVVTVMGVKDATAVLTRLQAVDRLIDGNATGNGGINTTPEGEWTTQPGEIPG